MMVVKEREVMRKEKKQKCVSKENRMKNQTKIQHILSLTTMQNAKEGAKWGEKERMDKTTSAWARSRRRESLCSIRCGNGWMGWNDWTRNQQRGSDKDVS